MQRTKRTQRSGHLERTEERNASGGKMTFDRRPQQERKDRKQRKNRTQRKNRMQRKDRTQRERKEHKCKEMPAEER